MKGAYALQSAPLTSGAGSAWPFVPEAVAQVDGAGALRARDLRRCSLLEDLPLCDDVRAIADAERVLDVVVGDEDADAAGAERVDLRLELGDVDGVDAGERLVEEDEAGAAD